MNELESYNELNTVTLITFTIRCTNDSTKKKDWIYVVVFNYLAYKSSYKY